jgi:hypothetical protein
MTRAKITKAWDTPPEDLPDFSEEDPGVLSSYFPDTFHVLWAAIVQQGWMRAREMVLGGREIHFLATRAGTTVHLRYVRQRRGTYYCVHASIDGVKCKLAEVTELVCTSGN